MKGFPVCALVMVYLLAGQAGAQEANQAAETEMAPLCSHTPIHPELDAYYPAQARGLRVDGQSTIDCAFDDQGGVSSCLVLSEKPVGHGFSAAALRIACAFTISNQGEHPILSAHNLIATGSVPVYEFEGSTRARVTITFPAGPPIRGSVYRLPSRD